MKNVPRLCFLILKSEKIESLSVVLLCALINWSLQDVNTNPSATWRLELQLFGAASFLKRRQRRHYHCLQNIIGIIFVL